MTNRHPPRLALALLDRLVPDSEPLAGDLVEAFAARRSAVWFWIQVLAAIAAHWRTRSVEIRPLQLVDLQPADAAERTRRWLVRFEPVSLNAGPVPGIGGLALAIFVALVIVFSPAVWGLFAAAALAGCALGGVAILVRQ
jgi:hypothetical protein